MLSPGTQFGKYTIESVVGQGGAGVVYRALDTNLERIVALKLINDDLYSSQKFRESLTSEARKAARIDSPFVVRVWEHSTIDNHLYIAMEFVSGEDLRTADKRFDIPEKVELTSQITEGIRAAHSEGLVHRDLKPENIRVTPANRVKILDFGLAKTIEADAAEDFESIEGSLYYLSPEQLAGDPITFCSDLFSFGAILYEMFTGERPFEGEYPASIVYSILHEDPAPPDTRISGLPDWLTPLIMKLLAKDAADRFETIDSVMEYVESSRKGQQTAIQSEYSDPRQKVTVIDLKNLSGDPSWDYFCSGFTEDVIREVSRRTDLVISAEPSGAQQKDVREMFTRYHCDYMIMGSLLKWQDNIRLSLSIYGSNGDKLISGDTYEGSSSDLFTLLSRSAEAAAESLAKVTGRETIAVVSAPTADVTAYDFYLKGRNYYQSNKAEDLEFAAKMYAKALSVDSNMALAHAGLSDVYTFQYMAYYDRTHERIEAAKVEAFEALRIDPTLPEGHRSLGRYHMFTNDYERAEGCFKSAVSFNPKYAVGYRTLGWLKRTAGKYEEALIYTKKALEMAPTDLETLLLLSLISIDQRNYTPAVATLQRAIELGPDYGRAYYNLGTVYLRLGVLELALENFESAIKFKGDPNCFIDAGLVHLIQKQYGSARKRFEESIAEGYLPFVAHYFIGLSERLQNHTDGAVRSFEATLQLTDQSTNIGEVNLHILVYRAMALAGLERFDESRAILDSLAETTGEQGEILFDMARCYALLGEQTTAQSYIGRACVAHAGPSEREARLDPHFIGMTFE
jgi:serine/threonine protein kinase/tetratricopeptide (TPR) repeat protein